jgi:hypothetical protein
MGGFCVADDRGSTPLLRRDLTRTDTHPGYLSGLLTIVSRYNILLASRRM